VVSDEDGRPLTPRAESALVAFATGGLPGLLGSLSGGASFEDDVDDPEALRRAEDAVARQSREPARRPGPDARPIDEPWAAVATQVTIGDTAGLDDVVRALESDGIDSGWDPYDPRDTVNFMPPSAGMTARRPFSITVPESQVPRARECLYGAPPQGVTYMFPTMGAASVPPREETPADADFGFAPSPAGARRVSKDGVPLSDNERLQRMAGGGPSIAALIVLMLVIVGTLIGVGGVLLSMPNR
jgi:hypothetical protein